MGRFQKNLGLRLRISSQINFDTPLYRHSTIGLVSDHQSGRCLGGGIRWWSQSKDNLHNNITMTETAKLDRMGANDGQPLEFATGFFSRNIAELSGYVDFIHEAECFAGMQICWSYLQS